MSEPIWCRVQVACPTSWGHEESKIEGVALIANGLINGEVADFTLAQDGTVTIWEMTGEGNYGLCDDDVRAGLTWCSEHLVPYDARSDAKYEMEGEIEVFDGQRLHERSGDGDGSIVLSQYRWNELKQHDDVIADIDAFFTLPDIESIDVSHLPAVCPIEEDDDE